MVAMKLNESKVPTLSKMINLFLPKADRNLNIITVHELKNLELKILE